MAIFTHIMVGSNDKKKSKAFYDAALSPLGIKNMGAFGDSGALLYGVDQPEFWVTTPANGKPACHANGGTIGFIAPSRKAVHEFHAGGLANGGKCEGEPGPRARRTLSRWSPAMRSAIRHGPDRAGRSTPVTA